MARIDARIVGIIKHLTRCRWHAATVSPLILLLKPVGAGIVGTFSIKTFMPPALFVPLFAVKCSRTIICRLLVARNDFVRRTRSAKIFGARLLRINALR